MEPQLNEKTIQMKRTKTRLSQSDTRCRPQNENAEYGNQPEKSAQTSSISKTIPTEPEFPKIHEMAYMASGSNDTGRDDFSGTFDRLNQSSSCYDVNNHNEDGSESQGENDRAEECGCASIRVHFC